MRDEGKPTGSSFIPHPSSFSVSVALCTFNGAKYLREQLDSLSNQTRRPDEVVVGDDASTDDSVAIVEDWAQQSGIRVRILRSQSNLGPTKNFERTLRLCSGDILMPCDQDDVWHPTKIARLARAVESKPSVGLAICQSRICDADLKPSERTAFDQQRFGSTLQAMVARGDGFDAFLRHMVAPGHALAIRGSLLPTLMPFPETCVYDQWIALVASALTRTALIDEPLVDYRAHASQITQSGSSKSLREWSALQGKLKLDHLQRNLDTFVALRDRIVPLDNNVDGPVWKRLQQVEAKGQFLRSRIAMRKGRVERTMRTVRHLLKGDYGRYGRGWLTFLRDLKGDNR